MKEFLHSLFSTGFMPHGHCYLWTPGIVWLHVVSDALIVLAYYSIPIMLVYFVRKRADLAFSWIFVCFAVFILACGTTHLMEIWNVWHSNYWMSGAIKALTALASVPTAILLTRLVPVALTLRSPAELERLNAILEAEIQTRRKAEENVRDLNAGLEKRVSERTAELNAANGELLRQISERKQADERFRLVVEASPTAIVLANAQGRILLVNSGAEKLFGYDRRELGGQPVEMLVPERFRAALPDYRADYSTHAESGPMGHGRELFALRKDGSEVPVEIALSPIHTDEGPLVLGAIVDITERLRAEEALRTNEADFRASFYSTAVGQAQVDPATGRYLRVNPKFCEIAGYSEEELLNMTFRELTHPDDIAADTAAQEDMFRRETPEISREKRYRRKDGQTVWVGINASLIRDAAGRPLRMLSVVQEITARKEAESARKAAEARRQMAEEAVRELNAELESRVVERTAQLEAANKELEAFSYSVSHDLRAPLRAMDGFSHALLEDYGSQLPEEGQRYLQTIRQGAQRMGALIDDLLTFSRLSRTPLTRRAVDLDRLVQDALAEIAAHQKERQIDVRVSDLPACHGDAALLKQVWINLLSNAYKYTRQRAEAVVEIGCNRENGETVYFIRDNGTGFDMRYAGKLFGVFQRLHRADEYEGTGVGLAIVQRVIHRHGGRIWADAKVDSGATFYFTLEASKS
jgi:PAS domain S-box-containing protein